MINIIDSLKDMGLSENEAKTYLALLRMGPSNASGIVQKTNIHRINIYDILNRLQDKGLVSYVFNGKRKQYEASSPEQARLSSTSLHERRI